MNLAKNPPRREDKLIPTRTILWGPRWLTLSVPVGHSDQKALQMATAATVQISFNADNIPPYPRRLSRLKKIPSLHSHRAHFSHLAPLVCNLLFSILHDPGPAPLFRRLISKRAIPLAVAHLGIPWTGPRAMKGGSKMDGSTQTLVSFEQVALRADLRDVWTSDRTWEWICSG